jgi:drug/metabolite transporter (DMT)-like permease
MPRDRELLLGTAAALIAATCFATLGPLSRFAADAGLGALPFIAWRAAVGAFALFVAVAARGRRGAAISSLRTLDPRGRLALGIAVAMGFTLNVAIFLAFARIPIAIALMLFYTYPVMVATVGVATGHDRMSAPKLVALLAATTGVVLVLLGGLEAAGAGLDPLGVLLGLGAAASQTVFITITRTGYRSVRSDAATLSILVGSAVLAAAAAAATGLLPELLLPLSGPGPWAFILVAGVVGAGFPSLLFLGSIRRIGGTRTGILMLWEPVMGALLAAILLAEPLGPAQALGGALVLTAAVILQLTGRRPQPEAEAVHESVSEPDDGAELAAWTGAEPATDPAHDPRRAGPGPLS